MLKKVGRICADLGPDCSLFVKSTKFSGMTELIMTINLICDMVPSQIFPVKLVFGVKIKLAAILTGSKYHLTKSTQN